MSGKHCCQYIILIYTMSQKNLRRVSNNFILPAQNQVSLSHNMRCVKNRLSQLYNACNQSGCQSDMMVVGSCHSSVSKHSTQV